MGGGVRSGGGGGEIGLGLDGQGGCERRSEAFVKIQKKIFFFFFLGGGGGGGGREGGGAVVRSGVRVEGGIARFGVGG